MRIYFLWKLINGCEIEQEDEDLKEKLKNSEKENVLLRNKNRELRNLLEKRDEENISL